MAGKKTTRKHNVSKHGEQKAGRARGIEPPVRLPLRIEALAILFILLAAICLLYPELVFQNQVFFARDTEAATSFAKAAHRVMIDENIYPFWNPYLFSGMPSYESLAYNPYVYPLSFVTGFLITTLHFPENSWLLFHVFLLGLGVYLLLRDRGIGFMPSASAALFMMWMPNLVAIGANGHGSQACAIAYIPYALLFWDRLTRGKGILLNGIALAIVLGFQMLRAHLQISYYTYALIGLHLLFFSFYAIVDAVRRREWGAECLPQFPAARGAGGGGTATLGGAALRIGVLAVILAVIVGCSLLISSVLYMPVHEYAEYSIRGGSEGGGLDYEYATSWSLHPAESFTFLVPFSFGFGKNLYHGQMPFTDYPNYLGLLVLLGCGAAVWLKRTRFVQFLLFVIVVSTLVSFGKHLPLLYDPLFQWMPFFNKFRVPVMVLIVQQFACVLLFAVGLSALLGLDRERGGKMARWGLIVSGAMLVIAVVSMGYWKGGFAESIAPRLRLAASAQEQLRLARESGGLLFLDLVKLALLSACVFGCLLLYYRAMVKRTVAVALLLLLGLADLYLVDRYIIHPEKLVKSNQVRIIRDKSRVDRYLEPDPIIEFLQTESRFFRVMPYSEFSTNRFMNFGISSIGGYHAAKLEHYNNFLGSLDRAFAGGRFQLLDMLNMRYLVSSGPIPESERWRAAWSGRDQNEQPCKIYENMNAFPRAWFVDEYRIARGDDALGLLHDGGIDLSRTAILEATPPLEPVSREGSEARITKFSFNEIHVDAKVAAPCIMVLSEVYYPRWKVTVNGDAGEILRADYILRAVALPAGSHSLVFEYDAGHIKRYFSISLITFLVLLTALLIAGVLRSKVLWKRS
jgi:hypothetical protein